MTIHKEGYKTLALGGLIYVVLNMLSFSFLSYAIPALAWVVFILTTLLFLFLISFFRVPKRNFTIDNSCIVAPADGKVVVIEEAVDEEYFTAKRLQVSIFMSPANVHVNRNPISGEVVYSKYHKGKYLVAWNPKSSTENERHSVVIKNEKAEILVKQIAGALAKRIINYLQPGQKTEQCAEMGFIKFGSRVDLLLPVGTKTEVQVGQHVKGGVTVIARL
ncbi:MAG: phosphatidylserine decarboxylase family protein [Chitinophagaceae bacterium]|nr:phosphatidylserine decarboxylase family protein [Chitinophagaceae bacterium]